MGNIKIRVTDDGSTTLFNKQLNEHYHSVYGAMQESIHVYINAGFLKLSSGQNSILEIGFGTGLNALLTQKNTERSKKKICYTSIEKYPVDSELISCLDFGLENREALLSLHSLGWGRFVQLSEWFRIKKIQEDLLTYTFEKSLYDLVYYDAFAPDKQPEMWEEDVLGKIVSAMKNKGILVTYSTKGIVKQRFRKLGLFVKRLPGPQGKRDMLYCVKE